MCCTLKILLGFFRFDTVFKILTNFFKITASTVWLFTNKTKVLAKKFLQSHFAKYLKLIKYKCLFYLELVEYTFIG